MFELIWICYQLTFTVSGRNINNNRIYKDKLFLLYYGELLKICHNLLKQNIITHDEQETEANGHGVI